MNLYEFNQLGYHALPAMNEEELENAKKVLTKYIGKHLGGKYYMLLNNDLHYYTLFTWKNNGATAADMANEVIEIAAELGGIKDIEENENGAIEIWVSNEDTCHMYAFFNYDRGVVTV